MCTVLYTTLSGVMCNLSMYIRCTFNALRSEGLESESAHVWYVQQYHPHYIRTCQYWSQLVGPVGRAHLHNGKTELDVTTSERGRSPLSTDNGFV